jgi:hypothetical protein
VRLLNRIHEGMGDGNMIEDYSSIEELQGGDPVLQRCITPLAGKDRTEAAQMKILFSPFEV